MSMESFPIGQEMDVTYPNFKVSLTLLSGTQLTFEIKEGPFARTETVDIQVVPLGNGIFAVNWQEMDGATVMNVQMGRERKGSFESADIESGHSRRCGHDHDLTPIRLGARCQKLQRRRAM
jgi:hypothetical protein